MRIKLIPLALLLLVATVFAEVSVRDYVKTRTITLTGVVDTSAATHTDTTRLGKCDDLTALIGDIRVSGPSRSIHGLGNGDTAVLVLKSVIGSRWFKVDSVKLALPCSTWVSHIASDTLFKRDLMLISVIKDTTNDSIFSWTYDLNINLKGLSK